MSVEVQGLGGVIKRITDLGKQARFAAAQACNDTAKEAQTFTTGTLLPEKFTLRSRGAPWFKPGTRMGFNIKFANKETLEATMGSAADWLKLQEEGGTKKRSGRLAIPTLDLKPKAAVLSRSRKPKRLLAQKKGFVIKLKKSGEAAIFERFGKAKKDIRPLYWLTPTAQIHAAFHFFETNKNLVELRFPQNFAKRFAVALATSK